MIFLMMFSTSCWPQRRPKNALTMYHEAVPNKLPYKWIKKYGLMTVETSNILIFKQDESNALDSAQKVVQYNKIFDELKDIHEV